MQSKAEQYRKIVSEYKKAQKSPYADVKKAFEYLKADLLFFKRNGK